jgi:hypothetical protein
VGPSVWRGAYSSASPSRRAAVTPNPLVPRRPPSLDSKQFGLNRWPKGSAPGLARGRGGCDMKKTLQSLTIVVAALTLVPDGSLASRGSLGEPHELDELSRHAPAGAEVECSSEDLVEYEGELIAYDAEALVHPEFASRLERFDEVVAAVATEVYGRPPSLLDHYSAFSCRRASSSGRVSEHVFGTALDVGAFVFPELPEEAPSPPGMPAELRDGFRITVVSHFHPETDSKVDRHHALFFDRLMRALEERDDIFRGMIGPPAAGHDDHLHLDAGPWRYQRYELPFG